MRNGLYCMVLIYIGYKCWLLQHFAKIFIRKKLWQRVVFVLFLNGQSLSFIVNKMSFEFKHITCIVWNSLPFLNYLEKSLRGRPLHILIELINAILIIDHSKYHFFQIAFNNICPFRNKELKVLDILSLKTSNDESLKKLFWEFCEPFNEHSL